MRVLLFLFFSIQVVFAQTEPVKVSVTKDDIGSIVSNSPLVFTATKNIELTSQDKKYQALDTLKAGQEVTVLYLDYYSPTYLNWMVKFRGTQMGLWVPNIPQHEEIRYNPQLYKDCLYYGKIEYLKKQDRLRKEHHQLNLEKYGRYFADYIKVGQIVKGMKGDAVEQSWGTPNKLTKHYEKGWHIERWYYFDRDTVLTLRTNMVNKINKIENQPNSAPTKTK